MPVVYALQTHARPAQITRLVTTIRAASPKSVILVNHDVRGEPLDVETLRRLPGVHVQPARGGYGDWSFLARWLDSAAYLASQSIDYDWLCTISGQDYPVTPLKSAEAEITGGAADGYIEHFPVLSEQDSHWPVSRAVSRYWYHHRRLLPLSPRGQALLRPVQVVNRLQPLFRVHVSFGLTLGWRARTPFREDFPCYGGSAWSSLRRECVEHVREFVARRPEVVAHYRQTLAPDESFLQTVLVNSGRFRLVDDSKRYFDFRGSTFNHPRVLGEADLPAAVASGAHFARKFDLQRDPAVFDALDRVVGVR